MAEPDFYPEPAWPKTQAHSILPYASLEPGDWRHRGERNAYQGSSLDNDVLLPFPRVEGHGHQICN